MKTDVVIVGAGPAGSIAAKTLAEKNVNVLLIEKKRFPRDKPCGGGLPIRGIKRFPWIKDIDVIESYSYGGYVHSESLHYKAESPESKPVIAMVRRKKFDNILVKTAVEKGAVFQDDKAVVDLKITSDRAELTLEDGSHVQTDLVIGADGVYSIVARKTRLSTKHEYVCPCVVEEFSMDAETMDKFYTDKRFCHIHLKPYGLAGYGWVFPKKSHLNIGLGEYRRLGKKNKEKKNLKELYKNYLHLLKENNIIPKETKTRHPRGGTLPVKPLKKTYSDRVLLVGDAAGFINPVSGEGIYYALVSGEMAAKVAAEAIENNDTSEQFLSTYQRLCENDFGRDIKLLVKSTKQWEKQDTRFLKIMSQDKKLAEMLFTIITGQKSIYELRWSLIKRYLYASLKYSLKSKNH